jgi:hypothetical protein
LPNPKPPSTVRPTAELGEQPPTLHFPMRVRRIRLKYANSGWEKLADVIIERKTLRHASVLPPGGPRGGLSYVLRDAHGGLLYWRRVANPFDPSVELFEPDGGIKRIPIQRKEAFVEILIPDLPEGARLEIFSDVSPDGQVLKHATMIRSIDLRGDKDRKEDDDGRR